jgi:hypothetical protein
MNAGPGGNITPQMDLDEHGFIGDVGFKKVSLIDDQGNQVLNTGFNIPTYDYLNVATPIPTREIYTFKRGGSSGDTVATVTINYTDTDKNTIQNATKA